MAEEILSKEVKSQIQQIGEIDILIGIPSFNNSRTIGHVVRAVSAGLAKYFPHYRNILVNSDGGSKDGTPDLVSQTQMDDFKTILLEHPVSSLQKIVTPYQGVPGKGSAFRTIFKIADLLNIKACAVVDSDLRSITPEWVELLVEPVLFHGFDFVAPYYRRHKYDGTITNSIVYPLSRALYGKRIRQPIGGDFGFSGKLARHYLAKPFGRAEVAGFGIDIWMTTTAIAGGFNVCQSFLGAKIHDAKDPAADLSGMLTQVVGSIFSLMEEYYEVWSRESGSIDIKNFGFEFEVGLEPIKVNLERMVDNFKQGAINLLPVWEKILSPSVLAEIKRIETGNVLQFHYPKELWVKTIYDFSLAFHKRAMVRDHLLRSLTPLYLGFIASFVNQTLESSASEVEQIIENICLEFEKEKEYLLGKWRQRKKNEGKAVEMNL